jgi:hypothetical protein
MPLPQKNKTLTANAMNQLSKYGRDRFIAGLISLFSISFLASAPFEKNPQDCEMISVTSRKKKQ